MIYVLATALVKEKCLAEALECYRYLVPLVLEKEPGCLEYTPTLNHHLGLSNQDKAPGRILQTERWHRVEDFHAQLGMPHCVEFRARIQPCLFEGIRVTATRPALELR